MEYHHLTSQNNKTFFVFDDELDYILVLYFAYSETTKNNVDIFLSNLSMILFTEKLFYENLYKQKEKFSEIL